MLAQCPDCDSQLVVPHSCGHRNCPHCQHHESQQWLERQLKKQVPADYFLLTFTLPAELRSLAWHHQRMLYALMIQCSWETVRTFSQNDKQLQGIPGAIAVLHTHSRRLDYHPHVHLVMPAAAIDATNRLWRTKSKKGKKSYLFNHKALAKVFRAKLLDAISREELVLPASYPEQWVVDCKCVGTGEKALLYLGRYLYKGVIQEKAIIACRDGKVTFRYQNSKTKEDGIKNGHWCEISVADPPACAAERVQARPQLRFFAPQQQAFDPVASIPARTESEPSIAVAQNTASTQMSLLWYSNEDRANAYTSVFPGQGFKTV